MEDVTTPGLVHQLDSQHIWFILQRDQQLLTFRNSYLESSGNCSPHVSPSVENTVFVVIDRLGSHVRWTHPMHGLYLDC